MRTVFMGCLVLTALLPMAGYSQPPGGAEAAASVRVRNMQVQIAPWANWMGPASQQAKYEAERGTARIAAAASGPSAIKVDVDCATDPQTYDQPLVIQVDFQSQWGFQQYDIQVLDSVGNPMPARRRYVELASQLLVPVPPQRGTYYVQVVDPRLGEPPLPADAARSVRDPATGLVAAVCHWYDNRAAAVSFRFDDSHPTHILAAVPMLREYGWKGTFFINPGNPGYLEHKAEWEACAARGDQEFANHTMHHRGATNDDEVEREIGEAARQIWNLFPTKSKLTCFSPGGGTTWTHSRRLRYFLEKYDQWSWIPPGQVSMTNETLERYRTGLARAIERKIWFSGLFHQIGNPGVSPENFRAVLEMTKARASEIWIAGWTDVFKYQEERNASALALRSGPGNALTLAVSCVTRRELYDQPLTIELALPNGWSAETLKVRDAQGAEVATRAATSAGRLVVRFEVPPTNAEYALSR